MKNILFILFPVLIFFIACDDERITDSQADTFVKYYGGNFNDEGMRVVTLDNGGYLMMGNMKTPDRGTDICVIITDKYGNSTGPVILYDANGFNDFGNTIKKNDLGYVIAGRTEDAKGKKSIFMVQIADDGTQLWKKQIDSTVNLEVNDIVILNDQSMAMTGSLLDSKTNYELIFVKTNPQGELIDSIQAFPKNNVDLVGNTISESDEAGFYLFAGSYTDKALDASLKKVFIFKWKGYGGIIGNNIGNEKDNAFAVNIIPQGENNFLVMCNVESSTKKQIKIKKIHVGGQITQVWEQYYGENEMNSISYGFADNNKIYLLGTTSNTVSEKYGDIMFIETENDGSSPIYHYVGNGGSFRGRGFDFTSDGGIIITGANKLNENSLITLIKLRNDYSL